MTTDGEIIVSTVQNLTTSLKDREKFEGNLKAGLLQLRAMVIVKIIFMLISFAGDISFLRAGSLSRNHFKGKKILRLRFRLFSQLECGDLLLKHVTKSNDLKEPGTTTFGKTSWFYLLQEVKFLLTNKGL